MPDARCVFWCCALFCCCLILPRPPPQLQPYPTPSCSALLFSCFSLNHLPLSQKGKKHYHGDGQLTDWPGLGPCVFWRVSCRRPSPCTGSPDCTADTAWYHYSRTCPTPRAGCESPSGLTVDSPVPVNNEIANFLVTFLSNQMTW